MTPPGAWQFDAIGTRWQIDTPTPLSDDARSAVLALIDRFDREWSRFRGDSLINALAGGGAAPAPVDAVAMLETFDALSIATDGAVNPLVGDSLARRGYDAAYSLRDGGAVAAPRDWRELLTWTEGILRLTAPATIDVGALGKGRVVDLVAASLEGDVVVDAGGDILVHGTTERVALEHPHDTSRAIGVWEITGRALCASAVNRRAWVSDATGVTLHHVLDARTGHPVRSVTATWAVAPTAMVADAVATALFFDGGAGVAHRWQVEWVRMLSDGRVEWSPECSAELFLPRSTRAARDSFGP